jgi:hypothetical protein
MYELVGFKVLKVELISGARIQINNLRRECGAALTVSLAGEQCARYSLPKIMF